MSLSEPSISRAIRPRSGELHRHRQEWHRRRAGHRWDCIVRDRYHPRGHDRPGRNVIVGGVDLKGDKATVQGNYIGTNKDGTAGAPRPTRSSTSFGFAGFAGNNNTIGGTAAGAQNVIGPGVLSYYLYLSISGTHNTVSGNYIGIDAGGKVALGGNVHSSSVLGVYGTGNTVGGTTPEDRNLIAGGVDLDGSQNVVAANYIGIDREGKVAVGTSDTGISITGIGNTIGGTTAPRLAT